MKKINLRGILEILSEKELKSVVGGDKPAKHQNEPEEPQTVEEAACSGVAFMSSCTLTWSGGSATGACELNLGTGKLECKVG